MGAGIVAAALLASSCGGGDDGGNADSGGHAADPREPVVGAVRRYQTAVLEKDAGAYCRLLTGDAKREVVT